MNKNLIYIGLDVDDAQYHGAHSLTVQVPDAGICDKHTEFGNEHPFEILNWNQCFSVSKLQGLFTEHGFILCEFYSDITGAPHAPESQIIALIAFKA